MPLTSKGRKIMTAMNKQYGKEKGERVFYASKNKSIISGVHKKHKKLHNPMPPYQDNRAKASSGSTPHYSATGKMGACSR